MGGNGAKGKKDGGGSSSQSDFEKKFEGKRINDISPSEARELYAKAPVGTTIEIDSHQEGDYVGELTKTSNGWVGSQRYNSPYVKPSNVKTEKGFEMQLTGGFDVLVHKRGKR